MQRSLISAKALSLSLLPLCTGCATMFSGSSSDVRFDAAQPGGRVYVGEAAYELPATVDVPKKTKTVRFEHDEYGSSEVELDRNLNGGYVLMDILFTPGFGLSGILVDAMSSAWMDLPTHVGHDFTAAPAADPAASESGSGLALAEN